MSRRRLALVMIVRDEARCIERCLHSVKPWVDEMLVLDTGSTDHTAALAQQAGARVHRFEWVDDFSAARNAALALSSADWNLVLDADEVLNPDSGPALQALRDQAPDFLGRIEVISQFTSTTEPAALGERHSEAQIASSRISRVLPCGVLYQGRIHEQPVSTLPRRDLAIAAQHDGYLPDQVRTKGDRNRRLLEAAVQAAPDDAYLLYQLGKDHEVHDRFEQACKAYERALALLGPEAGREPPWRHDLVLRSLYALKAGGQIEQAIELAGAEMTNWPDSPDFYFVLGDVLLDFTIAHPDQANELVPMIEDAWQRCLSIGENPGLEGAVHGRGSYLARHNLDLLSATWRPPEGSDAV